MSDAFGDVAPSARILARCDELAAISADADGLTRLYLTPEHARANERVAEWMREAGMHTHVDAVGNLIGRREGTRAGAPALLLGSHLDSVRNAGRYDGPLGVLIAIACVEALERSGTQLPFAIEIVGFADEEGVRYPAALIGSRGFAGTLDDSVLDLCDADGQCMADALRAFGLDPACIGQAARRSSEFIGYLELHIEQGPVLEARDRALGVVKAIAGATRLQIRVEGCAGHAGTVPMGARHDALAGAAECVTTLETICRERDVVGTVGRIAAEPGAVNVIAGAAEFSADVRSEDDARRGQALAAIDQAWAASAARRRLTLDVRTMHEAPACVCAPWLVDHLADRLAGDGAAPDIMVSGAGHDAMAVAGITDVAMLFMRCRGGISHHPDESVREDDVDAAARLMLAAIETLPWPKRGTTAVTAP